MGSMRERAAAATRYLRDIADTAEAVADCVVQAGVLLRRILGSAGRLVRGLVDTLRVLINGAGRIAIDVIRLVATFRELLAVFSADSRRRYRRAYRYCLQLAKSIFFSWLLQPAGGLTRFCLLQGRGERDPEADAGQGEGRRRGGESSPPRGLAPTRASPSPSTPSPAGVGSPLDLKRISIQRQRRLAGFLQFEQFFVFLHVGNLHPHYIWASVIYDCFQ
jgi:hypothetical protein